MVAVTSCLSQALPAAVPTPLQFQFPKESCPWHKTRLLSELAGAGIKLSSHKLDGSRVGDDTWQSVIVLCFTWLNVCFPFPAVPRKEKGSNRYLLNE